MFDTLGRSLAQHKNINATTASISKMKATHQVLLVKISTELIIEHTHKNETKSKRIYFKENLTSALGRAIALIVTFVVAM